MDKSTLLLAAIILAVFGASVAAGHPHWGTFTGIAIILLAAGLGAGTLPLRSQDFVEERTSPTQRISNGLITLSSAAIVAIYAAGYHRTSPAAHRFDSQTPQQRTSATIAIVTPPPAANPGAAAAPPVSSSAAPAIKKNSPSLRLRLEKRRLQRKRFAGSSAASTSAPSPADNPPAETAAPPAAAGQIAYKDGVYLGWGSCRHGDIEASVTIQDGKIALDGNLAMPDALLLRLDRATNSGRWFARLALAGSRKAEPESRLRVGSHREQLCIRRCRCRSTCPKPLSNDVRRTVALMGTVVTIHVVGAMAGPERRDGRRTEREQAVERAFEWFYRVEECCTRFEAGSEVMQLAAQVGVPVPSRARSCSKQCNLHWRSRRRATARSIRRSAMPWKRAASTGSIAPGRPIRTALDSSELCQLSRRSPRRGPPDDHPASPADSRSWGRGQGAGGRSRCA